MARKSFTAYPPTESSEIEINGRVFLLNRAVPGDVLLDFLAEADAEDNSALAKTLRSLFAHAIVPAQLEEWTQFIRDPANNVTLDLLAEIAGYVAEVVSGAGKTPPQQPQLPTVG